MPEQYVGNNAALYAAGSVVRAKNTKSTGVSKCNADVFSSFRQSNRKLLRTPEPAARPLAKLAVSK